MPPPTLEELLRDPKARDRLTLPQLQEFANKLKQLAQGLGRPTGLPDNPADFAVQFSGGEWKKAKHLEYISNKVKQLERQEIRRLMISLPPRNGKSWLLDRWTPVWWLSRHPKHTIILAGYGETFARQWGGAVRDLIIQNSEMLNLLVDKERTAADEWALTTGGGMICVGVGGALVGRGANLLIIDDPIKDAKEAASETYRERMWEWWQGTASTRLEPGGGVIMIATRWHEDDLLGRIEKEDREIGAWDIVKIPAIAEENDAIGRQVGDPLWPERWATDDPDYEVRKRTSGPYVWCSPAETPILLADFLEKRIDEIVPGDEIVGFSHGGGNKAVWTQHRLTRAVVKKVLKRHAYVWDVRLASGRRVACTEEHRWYLPSASKKRRPQRGRFYGTMREASSLCYVFPTNEHLTGDAADWNYLAGLVDGEGHIGEPVLNLSQSPDANPEVFQAIHDVLNRLEIPYTCHVAKPESGKEHWGRRGTFNIRQKVRVAAGLLRTGRLAKKQQLIDVLYGRGGKLVQEEDPIVAMVRRSKPETVYALETTTGNYIAWGYASSNSAQYQCRPSPPGGGMFPRDDWQAFHDIPQVIQTCDQMIQSWDFAMSQKTSADYTVGQVWARRGADFFLLDQVRGHFDLAQIERHMRMFSLKYPKAVAKLIEDTALGPAIKQRLQHEVAGMIPIKTPGGVNASTKLSRAQVMVPYLQGHNLYLPAAPDGTRKQWVWELIEEFAAFDKGAHDDQVDAASHAIGFMQPAGWRDLQRAQREYDAQDPANVLTPKQIQNQWFSGKVAEAKKRIDKAFNPRGKFRQW